jgi:Predicted amidophosphoribosyltransferases
MGWLGNALRKGFKRRYTGGITWGVQDCTLCGGPADARRERLLCMACDVSLPAHPADACPQCGIASPGALVCGDCLSDPPAFDAALTVFTYRFPLDQLIQSFKYASNLALADFFAQKLVSCVRDHPMPHALVAMPLARRRLTERGFNQALLIADNAAQRLSLPIERTALVRVRETLPQSGLPWKERRANVKGAFACATNLKGRHIALVDDVMTTGATLNEAAKVLKMHGAARVTAWVIARAEKEMPSAGRETEIAYPHV